MDKVEYMENVEYKHITSEFEKQLGWLELAARPILRFVPRGIPDFPSHGVDHSINIIKHIDNFIDRFLDALMLNDEEIYLLYLGAWLHDIGNILDRDTHHILSAEIIKKSSHIKKILDTDDKLDQVEWIVKYHSSKCDIKDVPEKVKGKSGHEIRLRFITSIFRIMDACEIIQTKCPTEVYEIIKDKLPPKSIVYWEAHMSISGIQFKNPEISVEVNDATKSNILTEHIREEIKTVENILLDYNVAVPDVKTIVKTKAY